MHEASELEVGVVPVGETTSLRGGTVSEAVVDYVNGGVDEMVNDGSRERKVDEAGEPSLRGGGVHCSEGGRCGGGTMQDAQGSVGYKVPWGGSRCRFEKIK